MARETNIERRGIRVRKTYAMNKGTRVFEYWALPRSGYVLHKLGQVHRVGNEKFKALRGMRSGTELKDFDELRDAENWIAECDTWGALEKGTPNVEA